MCVHLHMLLVCCLVDALLLFMSTTTGCDACAGVGALCRVHSGLCDSDQPGPDSRLLYDSPLRQHHHSIGCGQWQHTCHLHGYHHRCVCVCLCDLRAVQAYSQHSRLILKFQTDRHVCLQAKLPCFCLQGIRGLWLTGCVLALLCSTSFGVHRGWCCWCCLITPPHPTEYASTLHNVLVGLESSSLALWKLVGLAGGYLGLLLFTVYLASSEVRLPIVQYAKGPPPVSCGGCLCCGQAG